MEGRLGLLVPAAASVFLAGHGQRHRCNSLTDSVVLSADQSGQKSRRQHAPPGEKANLLAVTQAFSFLRYNDLGLLTILGGKNVMLQVPFLDEIVREKTREAAREAAQRAARETAQSNIVDVLEARFGDVPRDLVDEIESIDDEKQLRGLVRWPGSCADLEAFRNAISRR